MTSSWLFQLFQYTRQRPLLTTFFGLGAALYGINRFYCSWQYQQNHFDVNEYKKKAILIIGGGKGFGFEVALKLDTLGFSVIVTCQKQEYIKRFDEKKQALSDNSKLYVMDITNTKDIKTTFVKISNYLKENNIESLWGIVNNSGVIIPGCFEIVSQNLTQYQMNMLLFGPLTVFQTFLPLMYGRQQYEINKNKLCEANGGRIINISSVTKNNPGHPYQCRFGASMSALSYFTHSLRMELSPRFGIWCCVIEPGVFKTDMFNNDNNWKRVQNECDENIWNLYGGDPMIEMYQNGVKKAFNKFGTSNLSEVTDVIIHGLTSKFPKRTYKVRWGIFKVLKYLPVAMFESMVKKNDGLLKLM